MELNAGFLVLESLLRPEESAMTERRRVKQAYSLEERLAELATRYKEQASALPAGAEREALLRKARLANTGAHISDWLISPGLQSPK
ncbi:hypothetical protein ACVWXM_006611 [Bradyrhizobium sp. GM7.3]